MPDRRRHRGPHPDDARIFGADALPLLSRAVTEYSWLLGREYAETSALKLVGDRYQLTARQRLAVRRSACGDDLRSARRRNERPPSSLRDTPLVLDGYNVLITLESALSGAFLFCGRDTCYRDLASLHGTYRMVEETAPAIELVGEVLESLQVGSVTWYLDSPVSNSGRLSQDILAVARRRSWDWYAKLELNPDPVLATSHEVVASSDSWILDHCHAWTNLVREVVTARVLDAKVLEL